MKKYRVVVDQRNVLYIDEDEAETADEAETIAMGLIPDAVFCNGEDTYDFEITVEDVDSQQN